MSAIDDLKQSTKIRKEISSIYRKYHSLTRAVQLMSNGKIKHFDVKRAVDAIHYFGGGWPHENSKGRMEALLDAVAGMFKVLSFIGQGDMVRKHLAKHGITITLQKSSELVDIPITSDHAEFLAKKLHLEVPERLSDLTEQVVMICDDLQGDICQLADIVKDDIRPRVKEELGVDDPEYKRLEEAMKLKMGTAKTKQRLPSKLKAVTDSMSQFQATSQEIKKLPR